jgi:hypothetical protein
MGAMAGEFGDMMMSIPMPKNPKGPGRLLSQLTNSTCGPTCIANALNSRGLNITRTQAAMEWKRLAKRPMGGLPGQPGGITPEELLETARSLSGVEWVRVSATDTNLRKAVSEGFAILGTSDHSVNLLEVFPGKNGGLVVKIYDPALNSTFFETSHALRNQAIDVFLPR